MRRGRREPDERAAADARVAGHQRPRRLRLGHGRRRDHAALPRPAHRRAAGAARPHGDAQSPARAACACPTARVVSARRRGRGRRPERRRTAPSTSSSSGSKPACRSGATRSTASSSRSACCMPHRQNTVHVTYRLLAGAGPVRLDAAAVGPLPRRTRRRSATPLAGPYALTRRRRPLRARRRRRDLPPLRLRAARRRARRSRSTAQRSQRRALPRRGEPRLRGAAATCGARATSASTLDARRAGDARSPRPSRGRRIDALTPAEALARRARAARAAARARRTRPRATGSAAELVLAADQFIITPAGRVEDAARARAAGDEVAHGHRRLSLVHRLGPRHDDQPRRADAVDRPARRGRLHPAHVRALRARRPDPQHVSRRRDARASTTPPTRRCGSSTRSTATSARPATATTLRAAAADAASTSSSITCAARGSASASIPRDGLLRQGAEGYQLTWMDAKVGRLGRDAAARQGGRDQRALVQRAAAARAAGCARQGDGRRPRRSREHAERARDVVQRAVLVRGRAATSTTWSTASTATTPRCRPNQIFAISLRHPVLDRARWEPVLRRRAASGC